MTIAEHVAETATMRQLFPEIRWLAPLELASLFLVTFKPDSMLWLKVDVPFAVAQRMWPDRFPKVHPRFASVLPTITWKFPVEERRKAPRLR